MKNQELLDLSGLGVAMVTPFQKNGQVDYSGLQRLTEHLIGGNVDFLVLHGTTGETPTLTAKELQSTKDFVVEVNNGRLPVVMGIAGNCTQAVCDELRERDLGGISAILTASPAYNKPTQEGIFQHYKALNEASPLPIILYNVPGRTASNVSAATTLQIARELDKVVAVKEASGNLSQIMNIINKAPEGFTVLSGDDALTLPLMAAGAKGVISVVGNAFPHAFADLVHSAAHGNFKNALRIHQSLLDTIELLFIDGNPAGIKEILSYLNICENTLRLPLVNVSERVKNDLYKSIAEAELLNHA